MNLKEYKKAKATFMKKAQVVLAEEFKAFFAKNPQIDSLRWTQYTPYFNDGEECIFSRSEFDARVVLDKKSKNEVGTAEVISATETDDDGFIAGWDIDGDTPLGKTLGDFEETFASVDDVFKEAFGDHVQVVATRKGFKVEDYEHE